MKRTYLTGVCAAAVAAVAFAYSPIATPTVLAQGTNNCQGLPSASELRTQLVASQNIPLGTDGIGGRVGGLFEGTRMWGAIVNRDGQICVYGTSTADASQVWVGSQAIAKAKAFTANAFSLDQTNGGFPLSTARLYTFTQPGHSLWSLGQSNLFNSDLLIAPGATGDKNQIAGGLIFFGGGVPLYQGGKIVGGLGISGDTSCADHEIAKRVRHLLHMDPNGGPTADDIVYSPTPATASVFAHPVCLNTYLNGAFIGNEAPATYPKAP
jgi:uncharacterized protein GlcG (DUF336 family)